MCTEPSSRYESFIHECLRHRREYVIHGCDYDNTTDVYAFDSFCDLCPYDDVNNILEDSYVDTADS